MYPRKPSFTILPSKHNLQKICTNDFRKVLFNDALRGFDNIKRDLLNLVEKEKIFDLVRRRLSSVPEGLKNQSAVIVRTWAHQCECVVAQRFRRGQQMFCLYSRLWEERALKEFFRRMKQQLAKRTKEMVLSAVGVTAAYNWDDNRISPNEILAHVHELDDMRDLKRKTIVCGICGNFCPSEFDNPGISCDCPAKRRTHVPHNHWTVFIERRDMVVWRRPHKSGSYEYKMYGTFNNVCADDFINVLLDIDYRREWDTTAVVLNIIDKDPKRDAHGDVIYWEMLWPRFFSNRDYVFQRRCMVDANTNTILIVSRGTDHPDFPISAEKYRVREYESVMVIRPCGDYDKRGLDFGLTYYDNPGVNIPAAVTSWVAYRAMPEFLNKLREAAQEYASYCDRRKCARVFKLSDYLGKPPVEETQDKNDNDKLIVHESVAVTEKTIPGYEIMTSPSPIIQADVTRSTYWKYLQPTYYFS